MNGAPWIAALATGFALGATLIIAIGAQNAFVLRQGLRREHVGAVVAFCVASDAALMALGVSGIGKLLGLWPALATAVTLGGAAFLFADGLHALRNAWHPRLWRPGVAAACRCTARRARPRPSRC